MYVPLSDLCVLCRLTGAAENAAGCIDKHCAVNLEKIFTEKAKLGSQAASKRRRRGEDSPDDTLGPDSPPEDDHGSSFPGSVSVAFLGGTIERVRERCSGDCPVIRQMVSVTKLPGLPAEPRLAALVPDLNAAEKEIAMQAGMVGRVSCP